MEKTKPEGMKHIKLYLIGDKKAEETNSWLAMTNDLAKAGALLEQMEGASTMKIIDVEANDGSNQR